MGITRLDIALPSGHSKEAVIDLCAQAGLVFANGGRSLRPAISTWDFPVACKLVKPSDIPGLLRSGSRHAAFLGRDMILEHSCSTHVIELLDLGLNPVKIVVAGPSVIAERFRHATCGKKKPQRKLSLRLATEYPNLARRWARKHRDFIQVDIQHVHGSTEVFPPDNADLIIDNTASGKTLHDNDLEVLEEIGRSSTRLYASKAAYDDSQLREEISTVAAFVRAALEARRRMIIEANVPLDRLDAVLAVLPAMLAPTIMPLLNDGGYAVKASVPSAEYVNVLRRIREQGGRDILVYRPDLVFDGA
jgi:ATP phosphoribosyltransferase